MATHIWPSSPLNWLEDGFHAGHTSYYPSHVTTIPSHVNNQNPRLSLKCVVPKSCSWSLVSQANGHKRSFSPQVSSRPSVLSFRNIAYAGKTVPLTMPSVLPPPPLLHPFQGLFLISKLQCTASDSSVNSRNLHHDQARNDEIEEFNECAKEEGDDELCESYYQSSDEEDSEEEQEDVGDTQSDSEEEEDDCYIEFKDCTPSLPTSSVALCPVLFSISSLSSEESGFCDPINSEWSDQEECDFDEGLWHKFQEQACFTDIPLKSSRACTKGPPCTLNEKDGGKDTEERQCNVEHAAVSSLTTNSISATGNKHTTPHTTDKNTVNRSVPDEADATSIGSDRCRKRVTFKPEPELVEVHYIFAWNYAYRACRKGPWEQYAADRDRFCKKIQVLDEIIRPCLLAKLSDSSCFSCTSSD